MMNWVSNFYFREGPGVEKDTPKPKGLRLLAVTFGREWWELIKLNLLFLLAALPLVTLPAAYLAMVSVTIAMVDDRNVYLWRDFWRAFRSQFAAATLLGVGVLVGAGLAYLAISTYARAVMDDVLFVVPLVIAVSVTVLFALFATHVFVGLAERGTQPFSAILKASFAGFIMHPLPGLTALGAVAVLWLAHILAYPASVFLPVLVNFSLGALVTSFATLKGVRFGSSLFSAGSLPAEAKMPKMQSA